VTIHGLAHPAVGQLRMYLEAPDGSRVWLLERPGEDGDEGSAADDLDGVVLDDEGPQLVQRIPVGGVVPPGRYRPLQPLAALDGRSAAGTWTLGVIDAVSGRTGTFDAWTLTVRPPVCANPAVASTGEAVDLTPSSARLTGRVDAAGVPTSYRIEHGPTEAYGSATPVTAAGESAEVADVAAVLSDLAPRTTYHFRVVALRGDDVVATGADEAFTTPREPRRAAAGGDTDPGPAESGPSGGSGSSSGGGGGGGGNDVPRGGGGGSPAAPVTAVGGGLTPRVLFAASSSVRATRGGRFAYRLRGTPGLTGSVVFRTPLPARPGARPGASSWGARRSGWATTATRRSA
jgi:subtilisin-like proprotein convertase family protein